MSVSFTRAPTVAAGDAITSTQFATLAAAFNDRLKSGLGDGPWRILYYLFSLCRQIRNPDAGGNYPSLAEFFEVYQHFDPTDVEWPLAGPGENEGTNLAAFINAFVFGAAALDLDEESVRMARLPWNTAEPDAASAWALAKAQRGGYDPDTGGIGSPSYTAAREHWKIRNSRRSPHGNSYGGYQPSPEIAIAGCTNPEEINYEYFFTNTDTGATQSYPGSCSDDPTHVAAIVEMPWAYYVILNDGTTDILPFREWIEGPYTGNAALQKREANGIPRILNAFASEFRGSAAQRESQSYHLQHAFDFQRFCTSQYHLAPALGVETNGSVQPRYPKIVRSTDAADGTILPFVGEGNSHGWRSGFVLASAYVEASGLVDSVAIEFVQAGEVWQTIQLTPDSTGAISRLWFPSTVETPTIQARVSGALTFKPTGGSLSIEFTEIVEYKPNVHDYAIFLRAACALDGTPDGVGINESNAKAVSTGYFSKGCLYNINGQGGTQPSEVAVNRNAIFDAFRRLSQCVRLIRRQEFVGYEVSGGKSILYVRRHVMGLANVIPADAWRGIGPDRERVPSGDLQVGRVYEVRAGSAIYNGTPYSAGQRFTCVVGALTYDGSSQVYEADGILSAAIPQGYSNRWILGVEFKAYHPSESSIWKPSVHADYWPLLNRCQFYSPEIGQDVYTLGHFAFGNESSGHVVVPESPPGYTYARLGEAYFGAWNANTLDCAGDPTCEESRLNFYKSCRIYEPDVEIESVEWHSGSGSDEVLKVTLTGRLHHCDEADDTISSDIGSWDVAALQAEPFRSVENGLREYLVYQTSGEHCSENPGNWALNAPAITGSPKGSCYPHIRLTKLIPEPYDDGNDIQNTNDTRFEHDAFLLMELYLRAMCEGYVDGETSKDYACEQGTITAFDFTYENLCLQAFGSRWMNTFPFTDSADNRQGFGPMPNTEALASVFNQMSAAVNLLTRVRVMIPCIIEAYKRTETVTDSTVAYAADGSTVTCDGASEVLVHRTAPSPDPDLSTPVWVAATSMGITSSSSLTGDCDGSLWSLNTYREGVKFRYSPDNADITYALPESWRDQFTDSPTFLVSIAETVTTFTRFATTDAGQREECGTDVWLVSPGTWLGFTETTVGPTTTCEIGDDEWVSPEFEGSDTFYGHDGITECQERGESREHVVTVLSTDTPILTIPLA